MIGTGALLLIQANPQSDHQSQYHRSQHNFGDENVSRSVQLHTRSGACIAYIAFVGCGTRPRLWGDVAMRWASVDSQLSARQGVPMTSMTDLPAPCQAAPCQLVHAFITLYSRRRTATT